LKSLPKASAQISTLTWTDGNFEACVMGNMAGNSMLAIKGKLQDSLYLLGILKEQTLSLCFTGFAILKGSTKSGHCNELAQWTRLRTDAH
jgi:hypothetical protein